MSETRQKKDSNNKDDASSSAFDQRPAPTILSWSIRGISLLIVVSLIGYFLWSAARPVVEPKIVFEVLDDKIEQRGGSWAMPVEVTNKGTVSIHTLTIGAALTPSYSSAGKEEAKSREEESVEIPLLGPNEMVTATFWFDQDPRKQNPRFAVKTYVLP